MFCYKCGQEIDDEAVICLHCGCATKNYGKRTAAVPKEFAQDGVSPKSRLVALLLCIFLGVLGVHRFYLGKVGTGVLWLFTYGCLGIGWIIDIIMIACGKMCDKNECLVCSWE